VALLLAVVTLRDSGVYVGGFNHGNIPAKVERMIYQQFCFETVLRIPNVKPDDGYVGFGKGFDYSGLCCKVHRLE